MRTILVDDEPWSIAEFKSECEDSPLFDVVGTFDRPSAALEYAQKNTVDFALLDINMPEMDGITLGGRLRELNPAIIIVFVTAYSQRLVEGVKMKADYFVFKPYSREDVEGVLVRAQLLSGRQRKRIVMRTFGRFEVLVDDRPLYFSSAKAKELLALMVDRRGAFLTAEEILSVLWEDHARDDTGMSMCRHVATLLRKTLREAGVEDILVEVKNGRRIDSSAFDCDYYSFLRGDKRARELFAGEYMSQYGWAETTLAGLERIAEKE